MRLIGGTGISIHNIIAVVLLAALFILLWWTYPSLPYSFDVSVWQERGEAVQKVLTESRGKIEVEYPPLITLLMYSLVAISSQESFVLYWALFVVIVYALVTLVSAHMFDSEAERWWLVGAMLATVIFYGLHLAFERFDWLLAIALFVCWRMYAHQRYSASGVWLALGVAAKLTPIFLVPVLWILTPRRARRGLIIGLIIGSLLGFGGPALVLGPAGMMQNIDYMLVYQGERGVEVGSTWSGVSMLWNNLQGRVVEIKEHHGAMHNMALGDKTVLAARLLLLVGLLLMYAYLVTNKNGQHDEAVLLDSMLMILIWVIITSPVLSPQYLIWVVPLLIIWLGQRLVGAAVCSWQMAAMVGLVIAGGVLTQVVWPAYFRFFIAQSQTWLTVALNLRNLILVLWLGFLGWDAWRLIAGVRCDQTEV